MSPDTASILLALYAPVAIILLRWWWVRRKAIIIKRDGRRW